MGRICPVNLIGICVSGQTGDELVCLTSRRGCMCPRCGCLIWRMASLPSASPGSRGPRHPLVPPGPPWLCREAGSTEGQGPGLSWVLGSCELLGQCGSIPFLGRDTVALGPSGQGWHLAVQGAVTRRCSSSGITPSPFKLWVWGRTSRLRSSCAIPRPTTLHPLPGPGMLRLPVIQSRHKTAPSQVRFPQNTLISPQEAEKLSLAVPASQLWSNLKYSTQWRG